MRIEYRPIDTWPGTLRISHRPAPFEAAWADTLNLLEKEARALVTKTMLVQLAAPESSFYKDGSGMRSDRQAQHPGVVITLDTLRHGSIVYATDLFVRGYRGPREDWKANVRAIALALEALRKVERYGVADAGQQYAGWKAIGSGTPMGAGPSKMTADEAARFISEHAIESPLSGRSVFTASEILADSDKREAAYRVAAKRLHPDAGGDPDLFRQLGEAREILRATQ